MQMGLVLVFAIGQDFIFFFLNWVKEEERETPTGFKLSYKWEQMNWISEQFGILKGNKTWHNDATMWPYDASSGQIVFFLMLFFILKSY